MILPADPRHQPIAQGLSTGLSELLGGLAKGKAEKMHTQSVFQGLQKLGGGITPEQALGIASLPQEYQGDVIKQLFTGQREEHKLNQKGRLERASANKRVQALLPTIEKARELFKKTEATGPIGGYGRSEVADELDSVLAQLVLDEDTLKSLGSRGSVLGLKTRKEAKVSRGMFKNAALNRLEGIEKAAKDYIKDFDIEEQILNAHGGKEPANLDHYINNVKKLSEVLDKNPEASEAPDGSQVDQKGYIFEKIDGVWTFIGKSK